MGRKLTLIKALAHQLREATTFTKATALEGYRTYMYFDDGLSTYILPAGVCCPWCESDVVQNEPLIRGWVIPVTCTSHPDHKFVWRVLGT